mmetsp:Transcript_7450/g.22914  ORF Transcript_7450/g.22914 Transcript_7450/m.22914 type:complete len:309 (+) Transcript_7450:1269-2195(+)
MKEMHERMRVLAIEQKLGSVFFTVFEQLFTVSRDRVDQTLVSRIDISTIDGFDVGSTRQRLGKTTQHGNFALRNYHESFRNRRRDLERFADEGESVNELTLTLLSGGLLELAETSETCVRRPKAPIDGEEVNARVEHCDRVQIALVIAVHAGEEWRLDAVRRRVSIQVLLGQQQGLIDVDVCAPQHRGTPMDRIDPPLQSAQLVLEAGHDEVHLPAQQLALLQGTLQSLHLVFHHLAEQGTCVRLLVQLRLVAAGHRNASLSSSRCSCSSCPCSCCCPCSCGSGGGSPVRVGGGHRGDSTTVVIAAAE